MIFVMTFRNQKELTENELMEVCGGRQTVFSSKRGRAYERLIKIILDYFGLK